MGDGMQRAACIESPDVFGAQNTSSKSVHGPIVESCTCFSLSGGICFVQEAKDLFNLGNLLGW